MTEDSVVALHHPGVTADPLTAHQYSAPELASSWHRPLKRRLPPCWRRMNI